MRGSGLVAGAFVLGVISACYRPGEVGGQAVRGLLAGESERHPLALNGRHPIRPRTPPRTRSDGRARVVIEGVDPEIDAGKFPAKAVA